VPYQNAAVAAAACVAGCKLQVIAAATTAAWVSRFLPFCNQPGNLINKLHCMQHVAVVAATAATLIGCLES